MNKIAQRIGGGSEIYPLGISIGWGMAEYCRKSDQDKEKMHVLSYRAITKRRSMTNIL